MEGIREFVQRNREEMFNTLRQRIALIDLNDSENFFSIKHHFGFLKWIYSRTSLLPV